MGRPRNGPLLTRDRIVKEALALVDQDGLESLSMRNLAARLSVDPMSIYHHIANKESLLRAVVEHVFEEMAQPASRGDWRRRVRAWAAAYRAVAAAHPNLVLRIVADPAAVAIAAVRANESLFEALEASGLSPARVLSSADLIVDFVNGYCLSSMTSDTRQVDAQEAFRSELEQRPPDTTKALRRLQTAAAFAKRDSFRFGLDVIIQGLDVLAARGEGRR